MPPVLVLFAHPALEKSRVHHRLVEAVRGHPGITLHDLYEAYPDFDIDVRHEQELLLAHQVIVFQFPLYWYSVPPLLKQWLDLVLEHGWAYGRSGTRLRGKRVLVATSTGGSEPAYQPGGFHDHTLDAFLLPLRQSCHLCGMVWLPPYVVHGTHRMDLPGISAEAPAYLARLEQLRDGAPALEEAR